MEACYEGLLEALYARFCIGTAAPFVAAYIAVTLDRAVDAAGSQSRPRMHRKNCKCSDLLYIVHD